MPDQLVPCASCLTATIRRTAYHFRRASRVATTNDLKNGMVLNLDGQLWSIVWFQHHKPGKGGAVMRTKLKNLRTGGVVDKTFGAGEKFEQAILDRHSMQYLYKQDDEFVLMDPESFDQIGVPAAS